MAKYVYSFSEGYGKSKNLLGGKGVGLAEMAHLKIPIPRVLQLQQKFAWNI